MRAREVERDVCRVSNCYLCEPRAWVSGPRAVGLSQHMYQCPAEAASLHIDFGVCACTVARASCRARARLHNPVRGKRRRDEPGPPGRPQPATSQNRHALFHALKTFQEVALL